MKCLADSRPVDKRSRPEKIAQSSACSSSNTFSSITPSSSCGRKYGAHHLLEVSEQFHRRRRSSAQSGWSKQKSSSGVEASGNGVLETDSDSRLGDRRGVRGCRGGRQDDGDNEEEDGDDDEDLEKNEIHSQLVGSQDELEWRVNRSDTHEQSENSLLGGNTKLGGKQLGPPSNMEKFSVETFLDDHPEFLSDYILRKVPQSLLERWLFQPANHQKGTATSNGPRDPNFTGHSPHPASLNHNPKRQRSRSFTPLRKHSATAFEESGLSTPILITDSDGQQSFLRTPSSRRASSNKLSQLQLSVPRVMVTPWQSQNESTSMPGVDEGALERLWELLERMFRGADLDGVIEELCRGLKSVLGADNVEVFLGNGHNVLSGDLYCLDQFNGWEKSKASADHVLTGVIISQQSLACSNPDLVLRDRPGGLLACSPLVHAQEDEPMGAIRATRLFDQRSPLDAHLLDLMAKFASIALTTVLERSGMILEITRSEVFLELAHTVFREHNRIEPTIKTILTNFLTMIECERCQILLTCEHSPAVFKRVYDMQRRDLSDEGQYRDDAPHEGRFPINLAITGEVALRGQKINIHNLERDERFDISVNDDAGLVHRSMLCMPFKDSETNRVLGVISLINKEKGGVFTENDERFVEAFSIFCAIAIKNANDYESAIRAKARIEVAFDTMNYQASSSIEDAKALSSEQIPSSKSVCLDEFHFDYMDMSDVETCKATLRMFIDMGLIARFRMDFTSVCRWVLTVKKNYRNETVPYHNWYHGFNVTQTMFVMLRQAGWESEFGQLDCLGLLVACLSHDLDHRGTTNAFQVKSKNPLSTLYATSTLERHHLNQCLLILNIPGNRILENLTETEYSAILSTLERCILATDLAIHFREAQAIHELALAVEEKTQQLNWTTNAEHKSLLQSAMMTAADLAAITKPWKVHFHTTNLLAEEFWAQGDIERENFHESPLPMMDRDFSLGQVQIDFIDNVCKGVYEDMSRFCPALGPMLQGCLHNRERWAEIEAKRPTRNL